VKNFEDKPPDQPPEDEFPVDPDSDLPPAQQQAVQLLARGVSIDTVARKCKISQRQLYNWRHSNKAFIAALQVAQIEAAARVRGQMDALAHLVFHRLVEDLNVPGALHQYKPADRVKLVGILAKYTADLSPKVSVTETRTKKGDDDWPTAPADDGSPVEAQVVESEPVPDA